MHYHHDHQEFITKFYYPFLSLTAIMMHQAIVGTTDGVSQATALKGLAETCHQGQRAQQKDLSRAAGPS